MTRKELIEKCRSILYNATTNYPLNASDTEFLLNIFPLHPEWETKKAGKEIKSIIVKKHPQYKNKCFAIVFTDNSSVAISFTECINRGGLREDIEEACKKLVQVNDENKFEKVVKDWINTYENREITIGKFIDWNALSFNDQSIIDNFKNYYNQNA